MCIPLIARIQSVGDSVAQAELTDGRIVQVNAGLQPDVQAGSHVLLDRGLIVEVIDPDQVQEMLDFYAKLSNLWSDQDAVHV